MRPILALAILLVGVKTAVPEPKHQDALLDVEGTSPSMSDSGDQPLAKGDRAFVLAVPEAVPTDVVHDQGLETLDPARTTPAASPDVDAEEDEADSLDGLCSSLFTSAQNNDLPVPFFANLIWQESRLRQDAVSPVGALGIAQFMPRVAASVGLIDPFDPRQAIPASARFLRDLRDQFGNLGFVAAAYNAGARRVSDWLDHRRALPRETQNYVVRVTGRSIEEWRKAPPDDVALTFVRPLPCRELPAFADLEAELQAQSPQADVTQHFEETTVSTHRFLVVHRYTHRRFRRIMVRFAGTFRGPHGRRQAVHHRVWHDRRRIAHSDPVIEASIAQKYAPRNFVS